MGSGLVGVGLIGAAAPVMRRVRAYFAPVDRAAGVPTVFDAAALSGFGLASPPAPWIDLGWVAGFSRKSGTKVAALRAGAPGAPVGQVKTELEATVALEFESWGKLQMALAAGSQQMNLLKTAAGAAANGSGGTAAAAVPVVIAGSTAIALNVGTDAAAGFSVGNLVAVDVDYEGQVGFVGSGVSGGYVKLAAAVGADVDYVRRVTLNVGRVVGISAGILALGSALIAGAPVMGMQVNGLVGFCDREGGSFFPEWSALFVMEGEQGDRVIYHYPRLQSMQGAAEVVSVLGAGTGVATLERVRLAGAFRALPVRDANDAEMVLCFRSYVPGAMRAV